MKPQVDNEFQVRTLASFRCEGSFAFLQRVGGGFSVWAYEIAQNSAVLAGLAGDRLAFNQDNQTAKGILPDGQVVSLLDMHLYA